MPLPDFTDEKLRSACQDRCGEYGDPACYELIERALRGTADPADDIKPCGECLRDIGIEPGDEFDENAAVGRLL